MCNVFYHFQVRHVITSAGSGCCIQSSLIIKVLTKVFNWKLRNYNPAVITCYRSMHAGYRQILVEKATPAVPLRHLHVILPTLGYYSISFSRTVYDTKYQSIMLPLRYFDRRWLILRQTDTQIY